jgi:hypothetical protein
MFSISRIIAYNGFMKSLIKVSALNKGGVIRIILNTLVVLVCTIGCTSSPNHSITQAKASPISNPTDTVTSKTSQSLTIQPMGAVKSQPGLSINEQPTETPTYLPVILSASQIPEIPTEQLISEMLEKVNKDRSLVDLNQLTGEVSLCISTECYKIINRYTGSEDLGWAKDYVFNELVNSGFTVEYHAWSSDGFTDENIIARKPGTSQPEEEVYFVAHLDGVKLNEIERFPAADDNASSVVSLLELARVFNDYSFSRTLVLLVSTGEEKGTLGVTEYIKDLTPSAFAAIKYVVDIDMIGYDADNDGIMQLWHGNHLPSIELAQTMKDIILSYQIDLLPELAAGCG